MLGFYDFFGGVISNLRTFGVRDLVDILVITVAFYELFLFAKKSRAGQLVRGLILALICFALAYLFELRTVRWLLNNFLQVGFIAAVVLFQPELRRTLERLGQSANWTGRLFSIRRNDPSLRAVWQSAVVAICDAAEQLSDTRTGALMVLERNNNLEEIIRTGTPLSANVIPEMLGTIFYEGTPLHDGAVVIVVSEETGIISLAKNGVLIRRLDRQNLFNLLQEEIIPPETQEEQKVSVWNRLFGKGGAVKHAAQKK